MSKIRWLFLLFIALFVGLAYGASDLVAVPPLTGRVVDLSATFDAAQLAQLENRLRTFEDRKGSQIAVLIVPTTQPEAIEQYAIRVADQWKIGRKKIDDGAILVIAKSDHALRIEVGYGLEGALNDATSKRIVADIILPLFKQNDFVGGINAGVDSMIKVIDGELLPASKPLTVAGDFSDIKQILPVVLVAAVVLGSVMSSILGKVAGAVATGGIIGVVAWLIAGLALGAVAAGVLGFLFTLMGGGRMMMAGMLMARGGGRSGGGFSGGGGGFGGGGASGRW